MKVVTLVRSATVNLLRKIPAERQRLAGVILIIAALLLAVIANLFLRGASNENKSVLRVFVSERFSSLDPFESGVAKNVPIQGLVNFRLVTSYRDNVLNGQIAESWKSSNSDTEWRFTIRQGLSFSNGDPINSEAVASSFRRLSLRLKQVGSNIEFIRKIAQIDRLKSVSQTDFGGVTAEGREVVFRFSEPYPGLLETLSFGLFSVASRWNYKENGEWVSDSPGSFVGSGPYVFTEDSGDKVSFKLRENVPQDLIHARAFKGVDVLFTPEGYRHADIFRGMPDIGISPSEFQYLAGEELNTIYLHIHSWRLASGPLASSRVRLLLRDAFYNELRNRNVRFTASMFPLSLGGISTPLKPSSLQQKKLQDVGLRHREIVISDFGRSGVALNESIYESLKSTLTAAGFKIVERRFNYDSLRKNRDPALNSFTVDIALYRTSMNFEEPLNDIRMMFSPEGIQLPDVNGEITRELKRPQFSPQRVNEMIWSQGVVWPVTQISRGIWVRRGLDLSRYNFHLGLGELSLIGAMN